jgi:NitT/TauT family transport system substrate-binding protein
VQVRSDYATKYPEIVVAYLKATLEADRLFRADPEGISEQLAKWTGIDAEVYYAFHGPRGIQTRDYSIKPEYVTAIRRAVDALEVLKKVDRRIDVDHYVNDRFIRQAAKEFGYDYDQRLRDYAPLPFTTPATDTGKPVADLNGAGQIWVKGEAKVRLYSTVAATFTALAQLESSQREVRVTFVHDRVRGNKLFADKVWYVQAGGQLAAFLLRPEASEWAAKNGGKVLSFSEAKKLPLPEAKPS